MIAQDLKLLAYLLSHMSVVRVQRAQLALERIDVLELKFRSADCLDAFHHLDQPPSGVRSLVAQEESSLPLRKNDLLGLFKSRRTTNILPILGI